MINEYQYILEAIIVGIYCIILLILNINNLFIIGFVKHFLGYYINLHLLYCKYSYSCNHKNKIIYNFTDLIIDSIIEGILFIIFGNILQIIIINKYILYFIIGFSLHIISEIAGKHKFFCKKHCI